MASKDPAFLFYPGDWLGGTMALSRHQKGCYMDLLIAQFNIGPLSLETIKTVLGQDQATWTVLSSKFKQDSEGNFFNERLVTEMDKRKKFVAKQSINGSKGGRPLKPKNNPWVLSGLTNIENENENEIELAVQRGKEGVGEREKWATMPGVKEHGLELPDINAGQVEQHWRISKRQTLSREDCLGFWEIFKVQWLTGKKYYGSVEEVYSHFLNWTKSQKIEHGTDKKSSAFTGKQVGAGELIDQTKSAVSILLNKGRSGNTEK